MAKKLALAFLISFFFSPFFLQAEKRSPKDLPEIHRRWLEEEVVYIIVPIEKEVFLKLETDRERSLFIEAFWKHRDPTQATPENEFKNEHYRRISHANQFFGRGMPKRGWRTDRGRIYIILGEPNDIQRYEGKTMTYPAEVWFYQGKTNLGLPPGFNLVFYQEGGLGEYRLYSPLGDGPQALMTHIYTDPGDYLAAYLQLREFEPGLADVSLSLIPGEDSVAFGRPSMASDLLVQKVETSPTKQVKGKYAQKFFEYKDIVEVEYTANFIDNDSLVKVIKDLSGMYFVHYAIEPARLSVNLFENKYYTILKLNGTVSNMEGKRIHQFEKNISLEFNEEQIKDLSHRPFSIRDMFPLIPGNYKLSVLVKNEVSKEFTSLERDLIIPQEEQALQMTSLILGYDVNRRGAQQSKLRPFQIGAYQIYFQGKRVFLRKDTMTAAFQIHGLSPVLREKGEIKYTFFKNREEFRSTTKKLNEFLELPNIVEEFSLQEFPPDHYRVQVSLFVDGREILSDSEDFDITYLEAFARPWIYSKLLPDTQDPIYAYLIGTQLFNSGKIAEARDYLEEAFHKKPDSLDFALNLTKAYYALAEYKKIESVLLPFISQPQPPKYEVFIIMGGAYQNRGELDKAVDVFNKAVSHHGLNINLLNVLGECYFQLGDVSEALAAWEKSLEINPDQAQIKKNVEALKQKNE
ncbi:MAG: GWxTD domain-containing protein [Candidatus Aminicenantes bacterium]|nr:MAG: GWxTD domain-containing protein [Candidatus Aminicenantes bacterium]